MVTYLAPSTAEYDHMIICPTVECVYYLSQFNYLQISFIIDFKNH